MKDGILNINKPQEMTSFDVVAILRKKLGIKRIGHLGTLDPMAEGVLPVAIGKAARIMDYTAFDTKEYVGEFLFGITSDTDDIWGKTIALCGNAEGIGTGVELKAELDACCGITRESLEEAAKKFIGIIEQTPPMYAAIKVDGRKLYEYARAGQDVDIKSRRIYIEKLDVLDFGRRYVQEVEKELCYATVKIVCSKGTYIRSIARDMGKALGTGGLMSSLIRRRSGAFCIDDAVSVDNIRDMDEGEIESLIINTEDALPEFPSVMLGEWESKLFKNGVKLEIDQWQVAECEIAAENSQPIISDEMVRKHLEIPCEYSRMYRVFGPEGFIGMGLSQEAGILKAKAVLI